MISQNYKEKLTIYKIKFENNIDTTIAMKIKN